MVFGSGKLSEKRQNQTGARDYNVISVIGLLVRVVVNAQTENISRNVLRKIVTQGKFWFRVKKIILLDRGLDT